MELTTELDRIARRIRKKLRQIEHLESSGRILNPEEEFKVSQKETLREKLSEATTMKRRSNGEIPKEKEEQEVVKRQCVEVSENLLDSVEPCSEENDEQLEISHQVDLKVSAPPTPKKKRQQKKKEQEQRKTEIWREKDYIIRELEGHADLATFCAVDSVNKIAVTASRDTTLLVWSLTTFELLTSLRGHTDSVTGVTITKNNGLVISGSLDCTIKFWEPLDGKLLRSIYTYNGIRCLVYSNLLKAVVTGTDGGKIEFFNEDKKNGSNSKNVSCGSVNSMDLFEDEFLVTGSEKGVVHVWTIPDFRCLFVSEDVTPKPHRRLISSIRFLTKDLVIYGDSGCNLKLLNWKKGTLRKCSNHVSDVGMTDAIVIKGDLIAASAYDLDTGLGHINLFRIIDNEDDNNNDGNIRYVCSLTDEETSRIFSMAAIVVVDSNSDCCSALQIVTSGREVKVWQMVDVLPDEDALIIRPSLLPIYSDEAHLVDSGSDDDDDDDDNDENDDHVDGGSSSSGNKVQSSNGIEKSSSSWSWCSIM